MREVRRVPLDFDWPVGEVWPGNVMPDDLALPLCPDCVVTERWPGAPPYSDGLSPTGRSAEKSSRHILGRSCTAEEFGALQAQGTDPWCANCQGRAHCASVEQQTAYDAWLPKPPPVGSGWQLWEATSEGSPMSPVMATAEELAAWMSQPDRHPGDRWEVETALRWITQFGWAATGYSVAPAWVA